MSDTFYKIKLDLVHNTISNFVHVMQYDDGVAYIRAEIYKDWQLVNPNSEFIGAELRLKKPNGYWIKVHTGDSHVQVPKPSYEDAIEAAKYYFINAVNEYVLIDDISSLPIDFSGENIQGPSKKKKKDIIYISALKKQIKPLYRNLRSYPTNFATSVQSLQSGLTGITYSPVTSTVAASPYSPV